ncbi:MAG: type II secretion system protein [Bacilli bacterium]|nr:type II secretion system protein [Bacilli bacterium]
MKNKKGFTLIELLAVIVILGLLMAIAIPSVTKYITQSRKKTLVNSIDSFITSATTAVNNNEFGALSNQDIIYYIPVSNKAENSCISLEKGGTDPFGNWKEAYVAVNYNAEKYSYDYFFTFYDDAGYGMRLTKSDDIKPSGDGQIINPTPVNADNITGQRKGRATKTKVLQVGSCSASSTVAGGAVEIKTFTECGNTYSYEVGMTWAQWLSSSYNTTGAFDHTASLGGPAIVLVPPTKGIEIVGNLQETEVSPESIAYRCGTLPA